METRSAERPTFLSIGECMLEFARQPDGYWRLGYAGDTLNTAWYFRALVDEPWQVEYFTRIGSDSHSRAMVAFLEANRIATSHVQRDDRLQPGLYLIETRDGERSFSYWRSQSAARHLADNEKALTRAIDSSAIVYFSGITLAILAPDRRHFVIDQIRRARDDGKMTVFDPNIRPKLWENPEAMRKTIMLAAAVSSLALPSFEDEQQWFGDETLETCAKRYIGAGSKRVCVKNGGGPICFGDAGSLQTISSMERVQPLDSTGAGDAFNGGLLHGLIAGGDFPVSVEKAHRLSSAVIRKSGALLDHDAIRSLVGN